MVMCIFVCLKHAELSLPYVGEKVLMGSWVVGGLEADQAPQAAPAAYHL